MRNRTYSKGDVVESSKCGHALSIRYEVVGYKRDNNKHVYYKVRPLADFYGYEVVRFLKLNKISKRFTYIRGDRLGDLW